MSRIGRKPIEVPSGVTVQVSPGAGMILRRIAHAVTQQQWTSVLIELVILILGVFLGFQVSDWANARANSAGGSNRPSAATTPDDG